MLKKGSLFISKTYIPGILLAIFVKEDGINNVIHYYPCHIGKAYMHNPGIGNTFPYHFSSEIKTLM